MTYTIEFTKPKLHCALLTAMFAFFAFGVVPCAGAATHNSGADARPNIVFLLTDDQRADSMGCAGNEIIQTPEMDKLANDGIRFENAFATTPICCASRASIFSGLYSSSHGLERFDAPFTPDQFAQTYPAIFRSAGYYTGFIGKYGLGGELPKKEFDVFNGFPGQGLYFPEGEEGGKHLTEIMGDQACTFIQEAPRDRPFCLSISFKAPHVQDTDPRQFLYDPKLENLYAAITLPPPKMSEPKYFDELPKFIQESEARKRWFKRFATPAMYQQMVKGYYRLVSGVDVQIGRIRATLMEHGLDENTVIVFSSDNGFYLGERGLAGKWYLHEESVRVPLIVYDPRAPKRKRGETREQLALNIDLAPTLLAFAGIDPPASMQGRSLLPVIKDKNAPLRDVFFLEHHFASKGAGVSIPGSEGVRTRDWKYFRYVDEEPLVEECYHLAQDPGEYKNLIAEPAAQAQVNTLRDAWKTWKQSLETWDANPGTRWEEPLYPQ